MDLLHNAYTVSAVRDIINLELEDDATDYRTVKTLLIDHFGEDICFTYPKDQSKSQGDFLKNVATPDVVEIVRDKDLIKECAYMLKAECSSSG